MNTFQGTKNYVASPELLGAVNIAVALQKPLLIKGEPGVHALGLVLRHKGIGHAADRTAQTRGLAALEQNDTDDEQTAEKLKNGDD